MKKKLLTMLLCLGMVASLSACGGGGAPQDNATPVENEGETAEPEDEQTEEPAEEEDTTVEGYVTEGEGYTTTVRWCRNGDKNIYGELSVPSDYDGTQKYPTIVMSHGFNGSHNNFKTYVPLIVSQGIVCYTFDFCCGSNQNVSDGETTDYSVMTEVEDLKAVIEFVEGLDCVDTSTFVLWGESMGGAVTALTAPQVADQLRAVILFYPAFVMTDDMHEMYPTKEDIPTEISKYMGQDVSPFFITDVYDLDLMQEIAGYTGDVLILHGTADTLVPMSYGEEAANVYENATFVPIEGGNHGFSPSDTSGDLRSDAAQHVLDYLRDKGIIQ